MTSDIRKGRFFLGGLLHSSGRIVTVSGSVGVSTKGRGLVSVIFFLISSMSRVSDKRGFFLPSFDPC